MKNSAYPLNRPDDQADIVLATDHALAVLWMEKIEQELAGGCAARRSLDSRYTTASVNGVAVAAAGRRGVAAQLRQDVGRECGCRSRRDEYSTCVTVDALLSVEQ